MLADWRRAGAEFVHWGISHGAVRGTMVAKSRRGNDFARFWLGRAPDREAVLDDIRSRGPLTRGPLPGTWVTADHALCRSILRDPQFIIHDPMLDGIPRSVAAIFRATDPDVCNPFEPPSMLVINPPEHTRIRRTIASPFTPRALAAQRRRIVHIIDEALDELAGQRDVDLVAQFATGIPVAVIADLLGLPRGVAPQLFDVGDRVAPMVDMGIPFPLYRDAIQALRDFEQFILDYVAHGEIAQHGLLNQLAELPRRELVTTVALLVGAGFETTVALFGTAIAEIARNPSLLDDIDDWTVAVDEFLRWDAPIQLTARGPLADTTVDGTTVCGGETVLLVLGGANHDPAVFDHPHDLDLRRPNAGDHLSFSAGPHGCPGSHLARLEAEIALPALFARFPGLRLSGPPVPRAGSFLRGYASLPARLW